MDEIEKQKINLMKKIAELKKSLGGNMNNVSPKFNQGAIPENKEQNKEQNNINKGSRGCSSCSRKKKT